MEQLCVVCHDQAAQFRCRQCHKPVCDDCAFKDENGAFCSRKCAANCRTWKEAEARPALRRVRSSLKGFVIVVILALIVAAVFVYGAKRGWFGEKAARMVTDTQRRVGGD